MEWKMVKSNHLQLMSKQTTVTKLKLVGMYTLKKFRIDIKYMYSKTQTLCKFYLQKFSVFIKKIIKHEVPDSFPK